MEQIIGNAVPVKLGEFIGRCFLNYINQPATRPSKYQKRLDNMPIYDKARSVAQIPYAEQLLLLDEGSLYLVADKPVTLLGTYRKTCRDWIVSNCLYNYPVTESELDSVKELLAVRYLILKHKGLKDLCFKVEGYSLVSKSELSKLGYQAGRKHPAKQRYILYKLSPSSLALPCEEINAIPIVGKGIDSSREKRVPDRVGKTALKTRPMKHRYDKGVV